MVDEARILAKIDELDEYLGELHEISPRDFEEYQRIEKRRSCERLLQLCIECVIDICKMLVTGMRLGLPSDEDDVFVKLSKKEVLPKTTLDELRRMRGFRNILVHEYASVDDELVFNYVKTQLGDFEDFKTTVLKVLKKQTSLKKKDPGFRIQRP